MIRGLGLRARLVMLVLVALAPVFALVAWMAWQNQQDALGSARAQLLSQAQLAAAAQDRLLDRTRNLIEAVGSAPAIRDSSPQVCMSYFRSLLTQYPIYTTMGLVSPERELVCNAVDARLPIPAESLPSLQRLLDANRFMMGSHQLTRSGRRVVMFGAPVHDGAGTLQGVVYASLGVEALGNALISIPRVEEGETLVMDRNGTILAAYPPRPDLIGQKMQDAVVLSALQEKRTGRAQSIDADGHRREWAFARAHDAGETNFFIAVSVPRDAIVAPVITGLVLQLAVLLLTALVGGLAAWWIGERMMVGPARAMLDKAHALARGDLGARVALDGRHPASELTQLGGAFNVMAQALEIRRDELDAMLRNVEKEHALLDLIINNMSEGVVAADTQGRLLLFNAAAKRLFSPDSTGEPLTAWTLGHELQAPDGWGPLAPQARPLVRAILGENVDRYELAARRDGSGDRMLSMNVRPLLDNEDRLIGGLVVVTDISERRAAEEFARGQEHVLELIASGTVLKLSLDAIVRLIEDQDPDAMCSILLHRDGALWQGVAPSLPAEFNFLIDGLAVGEGSGVCGTAAFRRQPVVVENIDTDPLVERWRQPAAEAGVVSCWSTPVTGADGGLLATFAVYRRFAHRPNAREYELVEIATRLLRLAVERSAAEDALRDSEARFRELAENIQDVFYSFDPRTNRIMYVSPAYETLWGRSCASLMENPNSFAASIHPDDREQALAMRAQGAQRMSDMQYRVIRPDGSVRWVHDHSYPVPNASGEVDRVVGTARDITPRKQADLDLLHTNRALQMLSRGNEALVRAEDEQHLLLEICRLAVNIGGYQMAWVGYAAEDVGRSITPMAWAGQELGYLSEVSLSWAEDDPRGQGPAGRTIRSGHVVICEDIMNDAAGMFWRAQAFARGYRSLISLPLHDGRRTFGMLVLFSPNVHKTRWEEVKLLQELVANLAYGITSLRTRAEQKRIENVIRAANTQLAEQASLLDRAQDAIIVRTVENPSIRYWNKGAERLYGWTSEEALGRELHDLIYADVRQYNDVMQVLLEQGEWTGELSQIARDGTPLAVEGRWTLVRDEQGNPSSVLAINTDIRERKRARDQILRLNVELEHRVQQRTAQLVAANKELEAFSYSVSHDLRTPLNAIDGFSHLLERSIKTTADERQMHFLTRIRNGTRQMGELIEGLLLLAQISRASMRDEEVDFGDLAQQVVAALRERDPARTVQFTVDDNLIARGDPRLLRQVMENLVSNAWKFTWNASSPSIHVGMETGSEGEMVIFVRDNGAGFDMAHASKLFGAFQRLHAATDFPGTGIGLATVQRIIKRHGGRIWAQSSPGQGATFYFSLGREEVLPLE